MIESNSYKYDTSVKSIKKKNKEKNHNTIFRHIFNLYKKSMKPIETDEPLVVILFRPLGFLIAYLLYYTPVSPNVITILRGLTGIAAGVLFALGLKQFLFIGGIILFVSIIFDCADGQLARLRGTHSKFGTIIDSISDVTTIVFIYAGAGIGIYLSSPDQLWVAFVFPILGIMNTAVHIYTQGLFRFEYINYVFTSYFENLDLSKDVISKIKSRETSLKERIYNIIRLIFQSIPTEIIKHLIMPKGYRGYHVWYKNDKTINKKIKNFFKENYKQNNVRLLQGFSMLGIGGNFSVFVIGGLLGDLNLSFIILFIGLNLWYILMLIFQRISFYLQLKKAYAQINK